LVTFFPVNGYRCRSIGRRPQLSAGTAAMAHGSIKRSSCVEHYAPTEPAVKRSSRLRFAVYFVGAELPKGDRRTVIDESVDDSHPRRLVSRGPTFALPEPARG